MQMAARIGPPREKAGAIIRRAMRFGSGRNCIARMHFCGRQSGGREGVWMTASGVARSAGQEESGEGVGGEQRGDSLSFVFRRMIGRSFVAASLSALSGTTRADSQ
ncbi:hypothetical protein [Burkholderia sp. LMG 32019]|uniref:hypothetical protein n=1 Tax=Burkholderia sp. LMG 32019 TaxID=3158173 RepID=UPI003C2D2395